MNLLAAQLDFRDPGDLGVFLDEAQVALLDYAGALARFKAAQSRIKSNGAGRSAGDHIEASIIDTRTREVESLAREQLSER